MYSKIEEEFDFDLSFLDDKRDNSPEPLIRIYDRVFVDCLLDALGSEIPFPEYSDRPVEFILEVLGVRQLSAEQIEICQSIVKKVITNVKAAAGVGKSFLAASLTLWWIFAVGGRVITTAPTEAQVNEILWSEVRSLYDKNSEKLGGRRGQLFVRLNEQARAIGLTAKDANAFHGKHAENLLLILDEACGISREIDEAAIACITGGSNRLLRIGNPITDGNAFADSCAIQCISIPAWGHPNVAWAYELGTDGVHHLKEAIAQQIMKPPTEQGDNPVKPQSEWPEELPRDAIPGAISINWIEMIRRQYGERSAYWQSRIEAIFPEDAEKSIIPRTWFYAARARYDADPEYWDKCARNKPARHGLDVGDGGDPHAHAYWRGPVLYFAKEFQTKGDRQDVSRAATIGLNALRENPGHIAVDQIGVGAGALSGILDLLDINRPVGIQSWAVGVNFGSKIRKKYLEPGQADTLNLRADYYWNLREAFRLEEVAIAPLPIEVETRLAEEFSRSHFEETADGKIRMEAKEAIRKRLKRSPNIADAVVMAYPKQEDNRASENDFALTISEPTSFWGR